MNRGLLNFAAVLTVVALHGFLLSFFMAAEFVEPAEAIDDRAFMQEAARATQRDIELARLALHRANERDVREYARHLIGDRTREMETLRDVASRRNITLPSNAAENSQALRLGSSSNSEFDRNYIRMMIENHHDAVLLFERQKQKEVDDELETFIDDHLIVLRAYLTGARDISERT
jgi:putative membrane protein